MTGWGQDGPLAPHAGHDIDYIAVAGALHGLGRAGGPPQFPHNLLGDFGGGSAYLVIGVLAALLEARASGHGQVVDAAIVDGTAHLNAMLAGLIAGGAWREERGTNLLDSGAPFYDVYETADGQHMAVGAIEPQFYAELLEGLGLVDTAPDRSDPGTGRPCARRSPPASASGPRRSGPASSRAPTPACRRSCRSPRRRATPTSPHGIPIVEQDGVVQPAPAPRFSRTPAALGSPPSLPGQHSREALQAWGVEDVDRLITDGVVTQA